MSEGTESGSNLTVEIDRASDGGRPVVRPPRSRAVLLVTCQDEVRSVTLVPGKSVLIGREPPADVAIADRSLSRNHARFTLVSDEEIAVEDLHSTNGTWIGERRIERATLRPGEEVVLGTIVAASVHVVASDEARAFGPEEHEAFRAALEADIARAKHFVRPLAVLTVRALERRGERGVAFYPRIQKLVRPIDRVALYGAGIVEVLLAETGRDEALALARTLTAAAGAEVALGCGVAFFPGVASAEELIEASLQAGRRATIAQPVQAAACEGHRTLSEPRDGDGAEGPVMASAAMREVARLAGLLATAVIPVLIHGETGTGKEVLARLIHESGPRRSRPLVAVNCAAIPATLLESELFGHEKNAFSGALQQKKGLFEAAHGGTILLDEVGELPAPAQAALLRVLEEKRVRRVGATEEIEVNVRVLAATNRDLEAMVAAGKFRDDLLSRLNAMEVVLPPLRERRSDIAALAAGFVRSAAKANERPARPIAPEAMALLERYAWPGNVRELRNAVARAVVVAQGEAISPLDLPPRIRAASKGEVESPAAAPSAAPASAPARRPTGTLKSRVEKFERDALIEALREANDNQSEAARLLETPLRTIQHKISAFGIKRTIGHRAGDEDD